MTLCELVQSKRPGAHRLTRPQGEGKKRRCEAPITEAQTLTRLPKVVSSLLRISIASQHALDQFAERPEPLRFLFSFAISEVELLNEKDVVLEAGVEVGFEAETADDTVVVAVDVGVDAIQALEDGADRGLKVGGEGYTGMRGEDVGVREVVGGPGEEAGDVGGCGEAGGFGVGRRIVPEVLELVGGFHLRACRRRAELGDGSVEEIDLVVEVDHCICLLALAQSSRLLLRQSVGTQHTIDSEPFVSILAFGQLDHLPQTSATKCGLGELLQLPAVGAFGILAGLEAGLVSVTGITTIRS
nr:hypothetical protein CFP56_60240 [Quercus suber]